LLEGSYLEHAIIYYTVDSQNMIKIISHKVPLIGAGSIGGVPP